MIVFFSKDPVGLLLVIKSSKELILSHANLRSPEKIFSIYFFNLIFCFYIL